MVNLLNICPTTTASKMRRNESMGRNNKSLAHQLHERMNSMIRFGESKHQAKKEYRAWAEENEKTINPAKATGIFSYTTYESYKQTSKEFKGWLESNHPEIKKINEIKEDHVGEYLKMRVSEGKSPYTVGKDMAALNKILGYEIKRKDYGLPGRSFKEVTRSRYERSHDKVVNYSKYKDQIDVARATGLRRASMLRLTPERFLRDDKGTVTGVRLIEKGGKERIASVLEPFRERITEIVDSKKDNERLFERYPNRIDNHSFRREYALERYNELVSNKKPDQLELYRGYDKETILKVSEELGHNRLDVIVEHYLPVK